MVQVAVDWDTFIIQRIKASKGLEDEDAKKMAEALWQKTTTPKYRAEWKKFRAWHEDIYGTEQIAESNFVFCAKAYVTKTILKAMEDKNLYYEDLNNRVSSISGTIIQTMGYDIGKDASIQRLRDRAKVKLRKRKDTVKNADCIDIIQLLQAIDDAGKNKDLSFKDLRGKLIVLMIIDTAARPSTLRECMLEEIKTETNSYGDCIVLVPHARKDQHLATNKDTKPLRIQSFVHRANICTKATLEEYQRRLQQFDIIKDIEYAGIDKDGKPAKIKGTSLFVKKTKPQGSMATSTVRSEARKYLERIGNKANNVQIRHAVPTIIQHIDNLSNDKTASMFRWSRTDTYTKWYKSNIPPHIQEKLKQEKSNFPISWKLRYKYIDKSRLCTIFPKPKTNNNITNYFKT